MPEPFVGLQMAVRHSHFAGAQSQKCANWLIGDKCLEGSPHAVRFAARQVVACLFDVFRATAALSWALK